MNRENIIERATIEEEKRLEMYHKYTMKNGGFWKYLKFMDPQFFIEEKKPLKEFAYLLEKCFWYEIPTLMISFAPRSGKSYTISHLCSWGLGIKKTGSIMRNSSTETLVKKLSFDVMNMIKDKKNKRIFDVRISKNKFEKLSWALETSREYAYFGAGVGGTITGLGADVLAILDDHVKNIQQALSDIVMDNHWSWYLSTMKTRMVGKCPEILVNTRWSDKDIIGKLKKIKENEIKNGEIVVVDYPALDKMGKSFCESIGSTKYYQAKKKEYIEGGQPHLWHALYQQNCKPAGDILFPLESLKFLPPDEIKIGESTCYGYSDPADKGKDNFCSIIAYEIEGGLFIMDVIYTQDPIEKTSPRIAAQILRHKTSDFTCESNNEGRSYLLLVKKEIDDLSEGRFEPTISWKRNTVNKDTRILVNSAQIKHNMFFRSDWRKFPEYSKFINDFTKYDRRKGLNQVDDGPDAAAGMAAKHLNENKVSVIAF